MFIWFALILFGFIRMLWGIAYFCVNAPYAAVLMPET